MAKFIFISGGVMSSLGKGITGSSLGTLLEGWGLNVNMKKLDPYLNVDPGTMNPREHGEVFVTIDGAETDLDLGHYERFLKKTTTTKNSNVTSGKIYERVINREREGYYQGGTVQVVPHITNEIKECILADSEQYDIVIVEIGGTVGDIESDPFFEAIRQFVFDYDRKDIVLLHVTYVPYIKASGELKTKPTQHSIMRLHERGLFPDVIVCRSEHELDHNTRVKLSKQCNVKYENVINAIDANSIYEVPLLLQKEKLDQVILRDLNIEPKEPSCNITEWKGMVDKLMFVKNTKDVQEVSIAMVSKYIDNRDAYFSLTEALTHSGIYHTCKVNINILDAEEITDGNSKEILSKYDSVLIPGGFGNRGFEGKISAVRYARENNVPFLGICLGMQCFVVEFARNVLGLKNANSVEMDKNTPHPVICYITGQEDIVRIGGTMRLGKQSCKLKPNTLALQAYKEDVITERHRHRLEFNNAYIEEFEKHGLVISGTNPDNGLVEMVELPTSAHNWLVGCQFHPEFQSRPTAPNPLITRYIQAVRDKKYGVK